VRFRSPPAPRAPPLPRLASLSARSRAAFRLGGLVLLAAAGAALPPLPGMALAGHARRVVIAGYPNGQLKRRTEYRDGVLEGTDQGWYPSGMPEYEYRYHAGKRSGLQRTWNSDGSLRTSYLVRPAGFPRRRPSVVPPALTASGWTGAGGDKSPLPRAAGRTA
jgi:hypothetical protein